jgi:hypothetical protein
MGLEKKDEIKCYTKKSEKKYKKQLADGSMIIDPKTGKAIINPNPPVPEPEPTTDPEPTADPPVVP